MKRLLWLYWREVVGIAKGVGMSVLDSSVLSWMIEEAWFMRGKKVDGNPLVGMESDVNPERVLYPVKGSYEEVVVSTQEEFRVFAEEYTLRHEDLLSRKDHFLSIVLSGFDENGDAIAGLRIQYYDDQLEREFMRSESRRRMEQLSDESVSQRDEHVFEL